MKVVLDTNVLISAFLFEKRLGKIVELIEQGVITPCFVVSTFQEFQNVLSYKKFEALIKTAQITIEEIIQQMHGQSVILDDPKIIPSITADTPDNFVLAAAKLANAKYIVTGDKLLLSLKNFETIPIITPQKLLKSYSK